MPPLSPFGRTCIAAAISQAIALPAVNAAIIEVDQFNDVSANDVNCTLREAIISANTNPGNQNSGCESGEASADTITFSGIGAGQTISLTQGALEISSAGESLTISGPGRNLLTLDGSGNGGDHVIALSVVTANINALTILGGSYTNGGGIAVSAGTLLNLNDCSISGNTAATNGGGLFINGTTSVSVRNCRISNNVAGFGAGIMVSGSSTVSLNNTVLSNNEGANAVGLVATDSSRAILVDSTVSNNSGTGSGGGLTSRDSSFVSLSNSTVSGNTATDDGGGVYVEVNGTLSLNNSTVSGNKASRGGGVFVKGTSQVNISNSIISGNSASPASELENFNYESIVTVDQTNIFGESSNSTASAFVNFSPGNSDINASSDSAQSTELISIIDDSLAGNGGPTQTHALPVGSPAIDAATPRLCPPLDQRGMSRSAGSLMFPIVAASGNAAVIHLEGECDIGAVEFSPGD